MSETQLVLKVWKGVGSKAGPAQGMVKRPSSDRYRIAFVEGTASLEISRVDMSDAGNFTCRATNSVGSKDCSGALIVQGWLETVPFTLM